mgnify:CR=1 FL=1
MPIPVIVPISVAWVGLMLYLGVAVINARRLVLWLLGAGVSGALVLAQIALVQAPFVSVNSWAYWMTLWLPLIVHLWDRRQETYLRALRGIANVGMGIAALSLLFMGVQYAGVPYRDWVADIVPSNLLVSGYVVTYPITYGSPIYKSNAWIGLEPSFVSFILGACIVAAVVARMHWAKVAVLLLAMLSTTAGSGLAIVLVFIALAVVTGRGWMLRRYAVPVVALSAVFATTLLGEVILSRVNEAGQSRSSTSLRMIEPYQFLWPHWLADPIGMVLGYGPGSSAWVVTNAGVDGLLVPSVAKMIFDYGVVGGVILIVLMGSAFVRSPEPAIALAFGFSMFTVQGASPGLVVCVFCLASLWAPAMRGSGWVGRRSRRGVNRWRHRGAPPGRSEPVDPGPSDAGSVDRSRTEVPQSAVMESVT